MEGCLSSPILSFQKAQKTFRNPSDLAAHVPFSAELMWFPKCIAVIPKNISLCYLMHLTWYLLWMLFTLWITKDLWPALQSVGRHCEASFTVSLKPLMCSFLQDKMDRNQFSTQLAILPFHNFCIRPAVFNALWKWFYFDVEPQFLGRNHSKKKKH